jgi:sulfatase maturation enzyme AslB (radical SAM superfamily)
MTEIASVYKVAYHRQKLGAYLRGEQILPATLELDISTECNRKCPNCPSTTSPHSSELSLSFIERLFARLQGETKGLLLSGGEPTLASTFPEVLRLAREYGFVDIAIVTNGSLLDKERVASALCSYASAIRVSIYDWTRERRGDLQATLRRMETLRSRIEREGSELQIGSSVLTTKENADSLHLIAREVASAGAHWVYFHPMCIRWDTGAPERVNQSGVLARIKEYQHERSEKFQIFTFADRYTDREIEFSGYHAAHFLLVIGADGMNYLGAEVKYHPRYVIADPANNWHDDFLWRRERLKKIASVGSRTYPAVASRHRGILYNQTIQSLINRDERSLDVPTATHGETYVFPHIL